MQSVIRAGELGLPLVLAIIGGSPLQFAPLMPIYKDAATRAGHDASKLPIAVHSLGFVAESTSLAAEKYFPPTQSVFNSMSKERGWGHYSRSQFDASCSPEGAFYVGDPETVANKIINMQKHLGFSRFSYIYLLAACHMRML